MLQRHEISRLRQDFEQIADQAFSFGKTVHADDVQISLQETESWTVGARNRKPLQRNRSIRRNALVSVICDGIRASAATTDFSPDAIKRALQAATDIARYGERDDLAAFADTSEYCSDIRDLDLYHPWDIAYPDALELALQTEESAFAVDACIHQTEGASVWSSAGLSFLASSRGFTGSVPWSQHGIACSPVAMRDGARQVESWSTSGRSATQLESPEQVGRISGTRALQAIGGRQVPTGTYRILIDAPTATGLLGEFMRAVSGPLLRQGNSFLAGALGQAAFAEHVSISENPFLLQGNSSAPYDADGIAGTQRHVVERGILQGYFLDLYSARFLKMAPTGNGGQTYNMQISSSLTQPSDTQDEMLRKLGTGLLITHMAGSSDLTTGIFSRAVRGAWVQDGRIVHPVAGVTIASNLREMFAGIVALGADAVERGPFRTGSWLLENMSVRGSA
ncbi:MAG: metallopeptidase TldD-related protein [Gluconobacter oxydans]|uniref:TldD/PmbA family protein n=1 Tax=Gluconobacter oxydans TaxID=442 RepID=UPI0039EA9DC6